MRILKGSRRFVAISSTVLMMLLISLSLVLADTPEIGMAPLMPAEFRTKNLRISDPGVTPLEVKKDQTVTVTVSIDVENVGELEGNHTVELNVNREVVDSKEVTLGGGASETVLFELTRGEGAYEVEVEGFTESFTVNTQPEPRGIPGFPYASIMLGLLIALVLHLRNHS